MAPGGEVVGDEGDGGDVGARGVGGVDEVVHGEYVALLVCWFRWMGCWCFEVQCWWSSRWYITSQRLCDWEVWNAQM